MESIIIICPHTSLEECSMKIKKKKKHILGNEENRPEITDKENESVLASKNKPAILSRTRMFIYNVHICLAEL